MGNMGSRLVTYSLPATFVFPCFCPHMGKMGKQGEHHSKSLSTSDFRLPLFLCGAHPVAASPESRTFAMDMASDFEKWVLENPLTFEIAECLVYEASKMLTSLAVAEDPRHNVFRAFANLGRVALILGERFEEIKQELRTKAKEVLSIANLSDFSEEDFRKAEQHGFMYGWGRALPTQIGLHSIHHGFVAELVGAELRDRIRYVEGVGWQVWKDGAWYKRPKEWGIVGLIYDVMKRKLKTWREVLNNPLGESGWLEKLEKNINDPDWLSKVEELLLRVDYFGVKIVSDDD